MAENTEKILEIKVNYSDAIKKIAEYKTKIDALKDSEAELKKQLKNGEISRQQYNEELTASKTLTNEYNNSIRTITKTMQNQIKQEKEQEGSLNQLRARLSEMTKEYDAMSEAQRKGAEGTALKDQINEVTNALKDGEEETQRYQRNVGNYKNAIIDAANANLPFVEEINNMVSSMGVLGNLLGDIKGEISSVTTEFRSAQAATEGLSTAQKAAAVTTNLTSAALKILKVALISTGIGAIVVALGSLIAYLSKTQAGIELASKAMAALGAIVDVIIDRAAKLGGALVKLFSGDFSGAAKDAKEAFSGIGDEMEREVSLAIKLKEVLNDLDKQEVILSMRRAANKAQIEQLKKTSDDTTKSLEERISAAEKAYEIEKQDLDMQTKLAEARIANMLGYTSVTKEVRNTLNQIKAGAITADQLMKRIGLSESTMDDLKEFSELFIRLQELQEESYGRQTEQQNTLNSIRKEEEDAAREAAEAAAERAREAAQRRIEMKKKELDEVRKAEDEMLKLVKDARERQTLEIKYDYNRQIEDLKTRLSQEKDLTAKAREAINQQIVALEQQKNNELNKLSEEQLQKEISDRQRLLSISLESVRLGSLEELNVRLQLLQAQRDQELSEKELTEEMKIAIMKKYNYLIDDIYIQHEKSLNEKLAQEVALRMSNEILQMQERGATELEILQEQAEQKLELLNSIQQQEGETEEEFLNRRLEAQQAYTDAKQEIVNKEVEIEQTKYQAISDITSSLVGLLNTLGEKNKGLAIASKVLALAEIAINSGKAIAAGVAQAQSVPFPANIAAIATTVATILANITTAITTVKSAKFATGGLVTGPGTGTSDSIDAKLSNGESVMTARATEMFGPILSSFNQMGGGVPINVSESSSQAIGEDMMARAFAKGMKNLPAPVVSVDEINRVGNRVRVLESLGSV